MKNEKIRNQNFLFVFATFVGMGILLSICGRLRTA